MDDRQIGGERDAEHRHHDHGDPEIAREPALRPLRRRDLAASRQRRRSPGHSRVVGAHSTELIADWIWLKLVGKPTIADAMPLGPWIVIVGVLS